MNPDPERRGYRGEPARDEDFDRELNELISELRVLLPAVALLFAFLLTLPFTSRFAELPGLDRGLYFVGFVSSAVALVCLVAESAYHRLVGKPYDKGKLIRVATREAVAASIALAVALGSVVFVVTDILFSGVVATGVTSAVVALAVALWFVLPLWQRARAQGDAPETPG